MYRLQFPISAQVALPSRDRSFDPFLSRTRDFNDVSAQLPMLSESPSEATPASIFVSPRLYQFSRRPHRRRPPTSPNQ